MLFRVTLFPSLNSITSPDHSLVRPSFPFRIYHLFHFPQNSRAYSHESVSSRALLDELVHEARDRSCVLVSETIGHAQSSVEVSLNSQIE